MPTSLKASHPEALRQNEERIQRSIEWLDTHWRSGDPRAVRCEICGHDDWNVYGTVALPYAYPPAPGAGLPVVPITCKTCGNTKLLNAFTAGLEEPIPFTE
jgi:hypothetical protein